MAVNWKRPEGPFLIPIQKFFFHEGTCADLVILEGGDHPDPTVSFVCAPEREVARELGIDLDKADPEDNESGPLTFVLGLEFDQQAEVLAPLVPPSVQYEFFTATVEGEGRYVFVHDSVLDYQP